MILVTGATGQLGRLVINHLIKKVPASSVVAAVRNIEKAEDIAALGVEVRFADYNQPESWDAALLGIEKVLLISSSEIGLRVTQHQAVINAAKHANVHLFAYTSTLHADTSSLSLAAEHKATEAAIKSAGLPFVILRNGWYTENYTAGIPAALALGAVYGAAGKGRISAAARTDYAEAASVILTTDHHTGNVYELAGDIAFILDEFAAELSRQTGQSIPYVNLPQTEYKKALLGAGLPEPIADLLSDSDAGASKGDLFDDGKQLSQLIGRPTTGLELIIKASL